MKNTNLRATRKSPADKSKEAPIIINNSIF